MPELSLDSSIPELLQDSSPLNSIDCCFFEHFIELTALSVQKESYLFIGRSVLTTTSQLRARLSSRLLLAFFDFFMSSLSR